MIVKKPNKISYLTFLFYWSAFGNIAGLLLLPPAIAAPEEKSGRKITVPPPPKSHSVTSHTTEHMKVSYARRSRDGGGGMMRAETAPRSTQTVTKQYIAMRSPAASALDMIQMLPSVNITTSESSGMQGGNLTIRGLSSADMGVLWNDAPTTSILWLNEETDAENIDHISITPGSAVITLPTSTAAAGVMNVVQRTPSKERGGMVDFSYGTNNLSRQFIRLETGEIGQTGLRSFISFSQAHARNWMGKGNSTQYHIDFGLLKTWENGSNFALHTAWHNETTTLDNFPNEAQFFHNKHTGEGWGHSADYVESPDGRNNYWKASTQKFDEVLVTAPLTAVINPHFRFKLVPYLAYGTGWAALGPNSTLASSNNLVSNSGQTIASGTQLMSYMHYRQNRTVGAVATAILHWSPHHETEAGYWYENSISQSSRPINLARSDGGAASVDNPGYKTFSSVNGQLTRNQSVYDPGYEIHGLFIQHTAHYFHDRLTAIAGMKFIMSNFWDKVYRPNSSYRLGRNSTAPLPQLAFSYQINQQSQLYINASGDFRQPAAATLTQIVDHIPKNQYSIKEEVGYRYNNRYFMVDASFFNYNITDRLMTTYITPTVSGVINAGNQTSRGFDFLIAGHPFHHFSPYASVEYLHTTIDTNVAYAGSYLPTKGIQAPMAPHVMANFGLSYDDSHFFGNFGLHYAGPQSVTMVGDQRIPGYVTNNLSIGYHFPAFSYAKNPTFRLNFTNLTSAIVRSGANGLAINKKATTLLNGSQAKAGQGALFYVVPRFTMTGTISTNF